MFVKNIDDIYTSLVNFQNMDSIEWREVVSSHPKYFLHIEEDGEHYFGLSKFCAWKDITVDMYLNDCRYESNGYKTQKHLARILNKEWIPYSKTNKNVTSAFDVWIHGFYPNYTVQNANFITITAASRRLKRKRIITPETLVDILKNQALIGAIGERIALKFEIERLKDRGAKIPSKFIKHESSHNTASGYDIYSNYLNDERYIEVKATTKNFSEFYLTENEMKILSNLKNKAYLYLISITDKVNEIGSVEVIQNPIEMIMEEGELTPVAYRVNLQKK